MAYMIEGARNSIRLAMTAETASVAIATLEEFRKAGFGAIAVKDSDGEAINIAMLTERAHREH